MSSGQILENLRLARFLNNKKQQSRYDGGASGATQAGWDPQHQENIFNWKIIAQSQFVPLSNKKKQPF